MKYVMTGSLGHISRPVVQNLVKAGHEVLVISSQADRKTAIEALGAKALIGSVEDAAFVKNAFAGAHAVYLMIPPNFSVHDWPAYLKQVADNYVNAVKSNQIKHVVQLSSVGAHLGKGAGPVDGLAYLESELGKLKDTHVKMLRPSYFFYNLHAMAGLMKQAGIMGSNFGGSNEKLILVHTSDIADVLTEELAALNFTGHSVRYIASDERTPTEIAAVLSNVVNKPGTPWIEFTDEQATEGMLLAGLSKTIVEGYVQMGKSLREGLMQKDYWENKPATYGKVKLEDFAKEFAAAYNQ